MSWGKLKGQADKTMVIGDAMIVFPIMVASVKERLGRAFRRARNVKCENVNPEE